MKKKVLSLGVFYLCVACCFAQVKIAYCDVGKVLPFMPEMKELPAIEQEYEVYFLEKMEEKDLLHRQAFDAYINFAKAREVEEDDAKKVALENEVVALHNEMKFQQEEMDFAMQKIKKDAFRAANKHLIKILIVLAKEAQVDYVLGKSSLCESEMEIDFTEKVLERVLEEERGGGNLMRGGK